MSNLLPANASPLEKKLTEFIEQKLLALEIPIRRLWSPWLCPIELLPWLAWTVSVDEWDTAWSEAQKRQTVADSFKTHRKKGTKAAVIERLNSLGYSVNLTEWFEQPEQMPPFTFAVDIDTANKPVNSTVFGTAKQLIDSAKNTRSHLTRLRFNVENESNLYVAAGLYSGAYFAIGGPLEVIQTPVVSEPEPEVLGWLPLERNVSSGAPNLSVTAVAMSGSVIVVGFSGGYVSISFNSGSTFEALPRGLGTGSTASINGIAIGSGGVVVAVFSDGKSARSTNGGGAWSALPSVSSGNGLLAVATDGAGVWIKTLGSTSISKRSTDNGANWSDVEIFTYNGGQGYYGILKVAAGENGVWLAGSTDGESGTKLYRSTNSGAAWAQISIAGLGMSGISAIAHLGGDTFIIASNGSGKSAAITTNNGDSWLSLEDGLGSGASEYKQITAVVSDGSDVVIAVFSGGYASISLDRGENFSPLTRWLNSGSASTSETFAALATNGGGVWVAGIGSGYAAINTDNGAEAP